MPGSGPPVLRGHRLRGGALAFELANDMAAIDAGRVVLARFLARHPLGPRVVNRVEVIFEEVVSNIVRHGFAPGSAQRIRVRARVATAAVTLDFTDDGVPFDPLAVPAPVPPASLADAPLGGLGIPLVRRLSAAIVHRALPPAPASAAFRPVNHLRVTVAA